jgi:hypothetical protein
MKLFLRPTSRPLIELERPKPRIKLELLVDDRRSPDAIDCLSPAVGAVASLARQLKDMKEEWPLHDERGVGNIICDVDDDEEDRLGLGRSLGSRKAASDRCRCRCKSANSRTNP